MKETQWYRKIRKNEKLVTYGLVFFLTQIVLALFIREIYWSPTKFVFATRGDGGIIYYNMIYHALYGEGYLLKNMNYPRFESIFMTDAQASLSILLSWLRKLRPETIVGLAHGFLFTMFGIASVYVYKTFEFFKIRKWLAIIGAVGLVLLSPVTMRLQGTGHLGLVYPFVFTYTTYFFCKMVLKSGVHVLSFFKLMLVLVFFGLNNVYLIGINAAFLILASIPLLFVNGGWSKAWKIISTAIASLSLVFLVLKLTDIGSDRIMIQWGYEANRTTIGGIFYPPVSLVFDFFSKFVELPAAQMESWLYLGLSPLLLLLALPLLLRAPPLRKDVAQFKMLWICFGIASIFLLIYSSAILYKLPIIRDHIFHKFGWASMFKASGRFSYPVYFMSLTLFIWLIDRLIEIKRIKIIAFFLLLLWLVEINFFLQHHIVGELYENPFTSTNLEIYRDRLQDVGDVEAIYTLPVMEAWNDHFHTFLYNDACFHSRMISLATGLPLINATLSRLGVSDGARAIQLASNPLIEKEIKGSLTPSKNILLVTLKDFQKYTAGELDLVNRSVELVQYEGSEWRLMQVDSLNNDSLLEEARIKVEEAQDSTITFDNSFFAVESFDSMQSEKYFTPPGALTFDEDQVIYEVDIPDTVYGGHEISLYCKLDHQMFGNPSFLVKTSGVEDAEILMHRAISFDNYIDWVRVWGWIDIPKGTEKLTITAVSINQSHTIDDICIHKFESELVDGKKGFYNNFRMF